MNKKELDEILKTKKEIKQAIRNAIASDNWMVRTDDNGKSYDGFQWGKIGHWTCCPDWKPNHSCGNGLHGQTKIAGGFKTDGKRLVFCETNGKQYTIPKFHADKIKVQYARILMINSLPNGLVFKNSLDLSYTKITSLPENLSVGGYLDLRGTKITSLPENLSVGGSLHLEGTEITSLPENLSVGGYLDLRGTKITSLPENLSVGGYLYLRGTKITSLPENLSVGGSLYLRGTKIKTKDIPKHLRKKVRE